MSFAHFGSVTVTLAPNYFEFYDKSYYWVHCGQTRTKAKGSTQLRPAKRIACRIGEIRILRSSPVFLIDIAEQAAINAMSHDSA